MKWIKLLSEKIDAAVRDTNAWSLVGRTQDCSERLEPRQIGTRRRGALLLPIEKRANMRVQYLCEKSWLRMSCEPLDVDQPLLETSGTAGNRAWEFLRW